MRAAEQLVYGVRHPLSYNSGGEVAGIRTMKPSDIRNYHSSTYYLANMGTIIALPPDEEIDSTLSRLNVMLTGLQGSAPPRGHKTMKDVPRPQMAAPGTTAIVDYPNKNAQQSSPVAVVWPPTRDLNSDDLLLARMFFASIASDATSNLYKIFIDSKTRTIDIGATGIQSRVGPDQGNPIYVTFTDVTLPNLTNDRLVGIRKAIMDEIDRIAAFSDGSAELAEFNKRIESRLLQEQRQLSNFVNSPPRFGFRNGTSAWLDQLVALEKTGTFRRSVTMKPQIEYARQLLASKQNLWRTHLASWRITGVQPYAVAARPNPDLIARNDSERAARATAEAQRLAIQYRVNDVQQAIRRYKYDYEQKAAEIERITSSAPSRFVDKPPLTLDDQLRFSTIHA